MSSGIFKAFATVGSWTMLSRVLGFARDMLMSRILGTSHMADAYFAAFTLPNLFRSILAEGAFNSAFVPMYRKRSEDHATAEGFAQNAFSSLFLTVILLIALIQIFLPVVISTLFSGFVGNDRFDLAQDYTRITVFYIFFMSLAALCSGVLNSMGKFGVAAAMPVLLNLVQIVMLLIVQFTNYGDAGLMLSYGVFIGGLLQLAWVFFTVRKLGIKLRVHWPKWNDDMRQLLLIALPATMTAGVSQINLIVGRTIASHTDGAMSWLNFADRIYQLPLGVIGATMGVVLLPSLASFIKSNDHEGAHKQFNQAISVAMLLTLPAAFAIATIALPLVHVLFVGGNFTADAGIATAKALSIYALALPAFVLQKCLLPLFFARENTRTPMIFAVINMIINLVIALSLWETLGYLAPVIGSLISSWVMTIMLWTSARQFGSASKLCRQTLIMIVKFIIASAISSLLAYYLCHWAAPFMVSGSSKWLALMGIVGVTILVYFVIVMAIAKIYPRDLKAMARR